MNRKAVFSVTSEAAGRIQELLAQRGKPSVGIRISVRARGCSGYTYDLEYADEHRTGEEIVEDKGITLLIDPQAVLFVVGTEMDFVASDVESGFVFRNPNAKGQCGCGESFHV
jgi:iron-sulfur cluster assembly protein